jgi:phosphoglycerol transferase MdoB-like AlkP superfamily enzyme
MINKSGFFFTLRLYSLLLFIQLIFRLAFIIILHEENRFPGAGPLIKCLFNGFLVDSCVIALILLSCYLLLAPIGPFTRPKRFRHMVNVLTFAFGLLFFIDLVDIFYYKQFGTRLNMLALKGISEGATILPTIIKSFPVIRVILLTVISCILFYRMLRRLARSVKRERNETLKWSGIYILFTFAVSFLYTPQPFWVYASQLGDPLLNQAALNGPYTLGKSWQQQGILANDIPAYNFMDDKIAVKYISRILIPKEEQLNDSLFPFQRKFNYDTAAQKKNVIVIIVESFGGRLIESLGGEKGYSASFDRLAKDGILFTDFYANGPRTQNGLVSTVASFPAILGGSTIRRKGVNEFQTMGNVFGNYGYETHFLHNGYASFDDMDVFLKQGGFQEITDANDFTVPRIKNEWGVSDEDLYDLAYQRLSNPGDQPLLSILLTLSNHEPYEIPETFIKSHPEVKKMDKRRAAFYYTDAALGNFIGRCLKNPVFKNTVFAIVGDHGESFGTEDNEYKIFHVPLLLLNTGKAPAVITRTGSQVDIAPTLIHLAGLETPFVSLGQDLLDEEHHFPFAFSKGYGNDIFLNLGGTVLKYYFETDKVVYSKVNEQKYLTAVKAGGNEGYERFLKAYVQTASWVYRNGRHRISPGI